MKKLVATLLGASLISVIAGCGGGGPPPVDDSPAGQAVTYRQGVMESVAYKVGQLRAMAMGEIPVNQELFIKHANDVATLATMIPEGFIPDSATKNSAALPEIWTNNADFQMKAMDLHNAAQALATAAQQNGFEAAKGMVQQVGGTCGACHRPYRRRQE
ncbi:MAG TPA: cytochrome c [Gammaproteobacteria bacterium]|jgi:cytochrome c556